MSSSAHPTSAVSQNFLHRRRRRLVDVSPWQGTRARETGSRVLELAQRRSQLWESWLRSDGTRTKAGDQWHSRAAAFPAVPYAACGPASPQPAVRSANATLMLRSQHVPRHAPLYTQTPRHNAPRHVLRARRLVGNKHWQSRTPRPAGLKQNYCEHWLECWKARRERAPSLLSNARARRSARRAGPRAPARARRRVSY